VSVLKSILPPIADPAKHKLSGRQLGQYRRWATIALDANVLLGLYAYSEPTRDEFLRILAALKERIWLPHQAASDYAINRVNRIQRYIGFSKGIRELLSRIPAGFGKDAEKKHPRIGRKPQYPFLPIEYIQQQLGAVTEDIVKELATAEKEYEGFLTSDPIQDRLNLTTRDQIGAPLSNSDLEQVYSDGLKRYDLGRPPGYCDVEKPGVEKYGDLVLWRQLIHRAEETGHAVYFITDDTKEDWWQEVEEGAYGPRRELVEEMSELTSQRFLISTSPDFYEWAGDFLGRRTRRAAIAEARRHAVPVGWDAISEMIRNMQRATDQMLSLPYVPDFGERFRETMATASANAQLQVAAFLEEFNRSVRTAISLPSVLPFFQAYPPDKLQGHVTDADEDGEED